jgi:signal transduction histidine kinase
VSAEDDASLLARYRELLQRLEANDGEFRRLGRAVWRVQEDERRRLARELHDGVGQNLTALKHRLALLGSALPADAHALRTQLDAAIALCSTTLEDTRAMSRLLRPPILDDLGLEPALRWLARSVGEAGGPTVDIDIGPLPVLGDDIQTLLFRVAQEALNNAARHANARSAQLRLFARDQRLELRIDDDGEGCDPAVALRAGGSGLGGMRERLRLYGGRLELRSAPGEGMQLSATVPMAWEQVPNPGRA